MNLTEPVQKNGASQAYCEVKMERNFSLMSLLGLSFAILNTWVSLSAALGLGLPSGGSISVIWGLLVAGICNLCLAISLAEFLSAYPTAGGQYRWVALITPKKWAPLASWITGWMNTIGWLALSTAWSLLASQLISGLLALYHPHATLKAWQIWLIYVAWTLAAFLINAFLNKLLPYINKAGFIWSIGGFVVIMITVLVTSSNDYTSGEYVFTNFINETGWPDGIALLLGLLQGGFGLVGFDAVAHMSEEIPNASVQGPKAMIYCVCIGIVSGFLFLVVLLFVSGGNDQAIIESPLSPLLQILHNATKSRTGATCLLLFPLLCAFFGEIATMTTASRMTCSFARDKGLPASSLFAKIHPTLGLPLNALILVAVFACLFGSILIGSSTAITALLATSVIALGVSNAIPVLINLCRGRKMLGPRHFVLPSTIGWLTNLVGAFYTLVTTVFFLFPPSLPVKPANMNYCVAVLGAVSIISMIQWFRDGCRNFIGLRIDVLPERIGDSKDMGSKDSAAEYSKETQTRYLS